MTHTTTIPTVTEVTHHINVNWSSISRMTLFVLILILILYLLKRVHIYSMSRYLFVYLLVFSSLSILIQIAHFQFQGILKKYRLFFTGFSRYVWLSFAIITIMCIYTANHAVCPSRRGALWQYYYVRSRSITEVTNIHKHRHIEAFNFCAVKKNWLFYYTQTYGMNLIRVLFIHNYQINIEYI